MSNLEPGLFLVCYDYGMGGLWWIVRAPAADAITGLGPDLVLFGERPGWMGDTMWQQLHSNIQQLDAVADPVLAELLGDPV